MNIAALRVAALFLAFAVQAFGQEPESLWTPPGYRLLTVEERQSLPADELKAIGTRNGELLARALGSMTPEERDALPLSLKHFAETHTLSLPERQYVVQLQMRIASMKEQERLAPETEERKRRYEKLLVEQEASRGFASDQESIEREAYAIGELVQNGDARALYLRALKPLRARPWNNPIRHVFSRIVRSDPVRPQNTSLYDAALVFLHAREKENPEEGAWVSLEAYFRLVLRQEVDESRRLFDVAIAKGSKDVESHLYPILIAEMEGDSARVARLRPRSAKEWPKPGELDRELFYAIDDLPHEIGSRVRATFGKKFKSAYPAEWPARVQSMEDAILDAERKEQRGDPAARAVTAAAIEREATILLQLPLSALPEPSRTDVFALQLRSRSDGGRCHEVMAEIPRLERAAERAYPKAWDPNAEPVPRTLAEVAALRASLPKEEAFFERLKAAVADGSVVKWVELDDVAAGERLEAAHEIVAAVESGIREARELLSGRTDSEGAAELSRRELALWQKNRGVDSPELAPYDASGRAERLSIFVRASQGRCLLAKQRLAEAVLVLEPCVGGGRNYHSECVRVMSDVGVALVRNGKTAEAARVFERIGPSGGGDELYEVIEHAAPGTVHKRTSPPRT